MLLLKINLLKRKKYFENETKKCEKRKISVLEDFLLLLKSEKKGLFKALERKTYIYFFKSQFLKKCLWKKKCFLKIIVLNKTLTKKNKNNVYREKSFRKEKKL